MIVKSSPLARQATVFALGIAVAGIAGILTAAHLGSANGWVWTAWLCYIFALAYGANRLQMWLAKPPVAIWKSSLLGVVAFIPMFFGYFPASNWTMEVGRSTNYEFIPSPLWLLALMLWGLIAPGGVFFQGLRNIRSGLGNGSD